MSKTVILDVCCGGRMFYFDKHDSRVLFCDKRKIKTTLCDGRMFEINPDLQCDFTNLPFKDEIFPVVIFDPPHLRSNKETPTGWQQIKYGSLPNDWRDTLKKGFAECFRVLRPYGTLIFKWNETDIKLNKILELTDQKPVLGHKSGKQNNTHWVLFVKGGANV